MLKNYLLLFPLFVSTFNSYGFDYDEKNIIENIINHYKSEYSNNEDCPKLTVEETDEGTAIKSALLDTVPFRICGYHLIPKGSDFIIGDINGDDNNDVIVSVYSTGGGTSEWFDIFFFLSGQNSRASYIMFHSYELAQCPDGGGKFEVKAIVASHIVGETYCYGKATQFVALR